MVLDPARDHDELLVDSAEAPGFSEVDPDIKQVESISAGLTRPEAKDIVTSSRDPPSSWRQDVFGSKGIARRTVYAPRRSLRPPHMEPEQWICLPKRLQAQEREKWQSLDPEGFEHQEHRRRQHARMKTSGKVAKALPSIVRIVATLSADRLTTTATASTTTTIVITRLLLLLCLALAQSQSRGLLRALLL